MESSSPRSRLSSTRVCRKSRRRSGRFSSTRTGSEIGRAAVLRLAAIGSSLPESELRFVAAHYHFAIIEAWLRNLPLFFIALATDYDGTLAKDGRVDAEVYQALESFKATGRRLILVTGRQLPELLGIFPRVDLFDRLVAENGAVIYTPATAEERAIAAPPPPAFLEALRREKIEPLSVGRSIVATWEPNDHIVLDKIRDLGLELQITFNKGAVMVLPSGINKASGLAAALDELQISPHNVVGVGDAENDHAFLRACGCAAAVANALPMLKESADLVTEAARGAGVSELMRRIAAEDAAIVPLQRHGICLGTAETGEQVFIGPQEAGVLIAGTSGIGKSTIALALSERMAERKYQFCVFDPEGDFEGLQDAVALGDAHLPPSPEEISALLARTDANAVVNMMAVEPKERSLFFASVLPDIAALRARTGHPHWLLIDEAHQALPAERKDLTQLFPDELSGALFITIEPAALSAPVLRSIDTVIALGDRASDAIAAFCRAIGVEAPAARQAPGADQALLWRRGASRRALRIRLEPPRQLHRRHTRKYARGEIGADHSFYFRGPYNRLNLRAQNLELFLQIAEGVDDESLARETAEVEQDRGLGAGQSRARIKAAILQRYTAPAEAKGQ